MDCERLMDRVRRDREQLAGARRLRLEFLSNYVGKHYGASSESRKRLPLNHLKNAVDIWMANLAGGVPRVMVTTDHAQLKPQAADLEAVLNHELRMMDYQRETNRVIFDAMMGWGVAKTGMEQVGWYEFPDGSKVPYACQKVWCVDPDNWVHDTLAKKFDEVSYVGDRITLHVDVARQKYPEIKPKDLERFGVYVERTSNLDGGDTRPSVLSGTDLEEKPYRDTVEVYELWLPDEQKIVTCMEFGHDGKAKPLDERDWTGDDNGPYHMLLIDEVPQNILPLPPVATIFDIHELQNQVYNKIANQVRRQKTVTAIKGAAKEDGDRVIKARDGDGILVDDPKGAMELNFGGPDQRNLAFMLMNKDLVSYMGGNTDALGGLATQAGTVGQENLIRQSASVRMDQMAEKVARWHDRLLKVIAKSVWTDPVREYKTSRPSPVEGLPNVPVYFSADRREGDFLDYNFQFSMSSMKRKTPSMQLNEMIQTLQVFAPFIPLMEQQGVSLNIEPTIRNFATLLDNPFIKEMFVFTGAPQGETDMPRGTTGGPTAQKSGRGNGSEQTTGGREAAMIQALLGSSLQPKQQERMYG